MGPSVQLSDLAKMRAADVLPTPRAPVNRYACPTRFVSIALHNARATMLLTDQLAERLRAIPPGDHHVVPPPRRKASSRSIRMVVGCGVGHKLADLGCLGGDIVSTGDADSRRQRVTPAQEYTT